MNSGALISEISFYAGNIESIHFPAIAAGISTQWNLNATMNMSLDIKNHTIRRFSTLLDKGFFVELETESSKRVILQGEVLF